MLSNNNVRCSNDGTHELIHHGIDTPSQGKDVQVPPVAKAAPNKGRSRFVFVVLFLVWLDGLVLVWFWLGLDWFVLFLVFVYCL